jgi:hypothetical protein
MSLDVYLIRKGPQNLSEEREAIFIREDGQTKEVSREEWYRRFPDRDPVICKIPTDTDRVYEANITHNLAEMADAAGLYKCLWRPEEVGMTRAEHLLEPLRLGLRLLKSDPEAFKKYNPKNGWGDYYGLVLFTEQYLAACEENPDAEVSVSR